MTEETRTVYEFDEFRLDVAKRQLLRQGEVVPLYSKAFDLLLLLVKNSGADLSKDEILESIWPGQILEESNLTVNISAVRKALGEKAAQPRFLVTIPGRGYRFVAPVRTPDESPRLMIETQTQVTVEEETEDDGSGELNAHIEPKRISGTVTRRSPMFWAAAAGIVLITGAAAYSLIRYFSAHRSARESAAVFGNTSIKRLTTNGTVSRAALSADGALFAYSIAEGDMSSLWLAHVGGGEPVQIRPPAEQIYSAIKFAPDASSIFYSASDPAHGAALFKISAFGGAPEKIQDNIGSWMLSPDGRQLAFLRYDQTRKREALLVADVGGGNEHEVATMPEGTHSGWHSPAWSPDGRIVAVAASAQPSVVNLFVLNLADGSARLLTSQTWRFLDGITWLKDGSGMVAVGTEGNSLHAQLWYIAFPSGDRRQIINDLDDYGYVTSLANDNSLLALQGITQTNIWTAPAGNLGEAKQITFDSVGREAGFMGLTWTAEGRIVYSADDRDGTTLWVMNADGSKTRQLIPQGGISNYPSASTEGNSLVFQSNRGGHFAVWRSDLDGANMTQITGEQIAGQPDISPNGRWIVYNSSVDALGTLFRIPISGGEPFRLTDKRAGWARVSPDSKLVACQLEIEGKTKVGILSLETGEVLKSFDFPRLANPRLGVHWTLDSKAVTYRDWRNGIWKQPLDGASPKRLEGLPEERLFSYGWSVDGKQFAFARGATTRDVVLIKWKSPE